MAVIAAASGGGGGILFVLLIIIAVVLGIVFLPAYFDDQVSLPSGPPQNLLDEVQVGMLSSLPMTNHAAQGRAGTTMDADAIRRMIDERACRPIEIYVCPPMMQSKLLCYLKPSDTDELWAGVIVGINQPHRIITGFVAPYFEYWVPSNARDGCWMASRIN